MEKTFLFHTILESIIPGVRWVDDHTLHTTSATLQSDDESSAEMVFVWPVHDNGWSLDCLDDDCIPVINRVFDTFQRHVPSGRIKRVTCYMAPRKKADALTDPGWIEWGVCTYDHNDERLIYIAHIQRSIGADVERCS